ncbi:MAG TPA: cysteine desulfurase family protein [Thermoleophilia bacterium]|nr:cysteine desulfurase family protein [Thermoleophilia bacterium]
MTTAYFDHAATTPVDPEVLETMLPYFCERYGNPSELHHLGREARAAVEEARAKVAAALGAGEKEIVFTAGGTESDNLALFGYLQRFQPGHLIVSAVEHPAIMEAARALNRAGWAVDFVPVDGDGVVDLDAYEEAFREDTRLASIMYANNVVGTVQPVAELARIAHEKGAAFHTDAVQAVGALPIDVGELGVDMLSLSGHKLYGPKGVGALYVKRGTRLQPILHGGGHERRLRSGTENVPGVVGMGAAMTLAADLQPEVRPRLEALRDRLAAGLVERIPELNYLGHRTERLPGNAAFTVRYVEGESMLLQLDAAGFMVSSGSACASGSLEPSHVLLAMGLGAEEAHGSIRVSLGRENTDEEVDAFLDAFPPIVDKLRQMSPLYAKG